ncbi:MAG: FMN-binding negative transcriptional regulator [Paracoccaceae bacterium]
MHSPPEFQENRIDVLCAAIERIQLAALVSPTGSGMEITHVPVVVRREDGRLSLETHIARSNSHWRALGPHIGSVAIFQGPHAYVSPSWYPSKEEHGKVVPTWAYIVVHAHGVLEPTTDYDWLRRHLDMVTEANEADKKRPWRVADAPEGFIRSMSRGVVGLSMEVERLHGCWKVNQHKTGPDLLGSIAGFEGAGESGRALAEELKKLTR